MVIEALDGVDEGVKVGGNLLKDRMVLMKVSKLEGIC